MSPIALTDEQLDIVRRAAEPLQPHDRGVFLQTVAELLNGHEIGDGVSQERRARRKPASCARGISRTKRASRSIADGAITRLSCRWPASSAGNA